jgi:hypothetical protein
MSNNKQTAVEWLEIVLIPDPISEEDFEHNINCWKQAKEMEKEQIEEAYKYARAHWSREDGNAERYYNETYGGNK